MSTVSEPAPAGSGQRAARPLTGAQAVAAVIAGQERPVVYGMPGGYTMHIYDALFALRDRVDTRLVRQESVATVMAEAIYNEGLLWHREHSDIAEADWEEV